MKRENSKENKDISKHKAIQLDNSLATCPDNELYIDTTKEILFTLDFITKEKHLTGIESHLCDSCNPLVKYLCNSEAFNDTFLDAPLNGFHSKLPILPVLYVILHIYQFMTLCT